MANVIELTVAWLGASVLNISAIFSHKKQSHNETQYFQSTTRIDDTIICILFGVVILVTERGHSQPSYQTPQNAHRSQSFAFIHNHFCSFVCRFYYFTVPHTLETFVKKSQNDLLCLLSSGSFSRGAQFIYGPPQRLNTTCGELGNCVRSKPLSSAFDLLAFGIKEILGIFNMKYRPSDPKCCAVAVIRQKEEKKAIICRGRRPAANETMPNGG